MQESRGLPSGDVSCRVTEYTIQYLGRMKFPTQHLTRGLSYTLEDLQITSASIPWDDYLTFFRNSHEGLSPEQIVELCSSYNRSRYLRPLLAAAGLWIKPSRYYELAGESKKGVLSQIFRCLQTEFTHVNGRDVEIAIFVQDGFSLPPDLFWQTQAIGLGAVTTNVGLSPSIVTWEPIERGAVFRIRVPVRRPLRFAFLWLASWFRREAAEDVRTALAYGHERGMRLEQEIEQRKRAEAQLREQSAKLELLTASSVAYILEVDRGGVIRYANRAAEGRKVDDLIGKCVTDFATEPERSRALRIFEHVFDTKRSFTGEFSAPDGSGIARVYTVTISPVPYEGQVDWLVLTAFDITEQRAAEAKVSENDELLRKLTEQVPGILYQYQRWPDGRSCFPYASKAIQDIFGVTPEDVRASGMKIFQRVHADDLDAVFASILRSEETMETWRCECRVHVPKLGLRWVEGHAVPQRMQDGSILWHGFIRDFTGRKHAELALTASELRYRTLIETSSDAIFQTDLNGNILNANSAAAKMHGHTLDELLSMRIQELDVPESAVGFTDRMKRLQQGEWLTFEVWHHRKDGSTFPLEVIASAVELEGEWVVLTFGRDITERVKADECVRASLREKESLLKEVHHRVKNNLQVISSLLSLQSAHHSHSAANEVLSESQNRIRAMALVHETLYRAEDFASVNLAKYLSELCGHLFQAYGIESNRIQFVQDLHSTELSLDKTITCGLLVTEVVSNSLKYAFPSSRGGTVRIGLQTEPDGRMLMLLSDDGIGMPSDISLEHGPSLGLKLVSILVDQLGGELKIRRENGTAFEITFVL